MNNILSNLTHSRNASLLHDVDKARILISISRRFVARDAISRTYSIEVILCPAMYNQSFVTGASRVGKKKCSVAVYVIIRMHRVSRANLMSEIRLVKAPSSRPASPRFWNADLQIRASINCSIITVANCRSPIFRNPLASVVPFQA
jgi:hypothetical protein